MNRPQYYQDVITQKSWQFLQEIKKTVPFILIGGWAVYLYTNALKSKDIDIIIDYADLPTLEKLGKIYKNERLLKYELKKEEVDVDIYLPHYSQVGIPAEIINKHISKVETFTLPEKEILVITKLAAYENRKISAKGQKDKLDILSLILLKDFDLNKLREYALRYKQIACFQSLIVIVETTYEAEELGLNRHGFARRKSEILMKLGK